MLTRDTTESEIQPTKGTGAMAINGVFKAALIDFSLRPIDDLVRIRLNPASGSAGGQPMQTPEFPYRGAPACRVTGIACQAAGTDYVVEVQTRRYQTASVIQRISAVEGPALSVRLSIDPARVRNILLKGSYEGLDEQLRNVLAASEIDQMQDPAVPGSFLQGERLFGTLDALRKACLLNVWCKASHSSSENAWRHVKAIRRLEQDRVFARVNEDLFAAVSQSSKFSEAPNTLHEPMPGFERDRSFKTVDNRANLQISFMRRNGELAADIDIDEASGLAHAGEVVRNFVRGKTSPYRIYELLFVDKELEPPYSFVF